MICAFIISGKNSVSQSQMLPGPACVLLIWFITSSKVLWSSIGSWKIYFGGFYWEGQFKVWQQEIWKEVPLMPLLPRLQAPGSRQRRIWSMKKWLFALQPFSLQCLELPPEFSLPASFLWSILTFVHHVSGHLNLPRECMEYERWFRIRRRRSDRILFQLDPSTLTAACT